MNAILAWLATYALHSTILLGAVGLLTAVLVRRDGWRDVLWKAALVGGLVTASLQIALAVRPLVRPWRLSWEPAARQQEPGLGLQDSGPRREAAPVARMTAPGREPLEPVSAPAATIPWSTVLVITWVALALVLSLRLAALYIRLYRMLRDRQPVDDTRALAVLTELRRHAGVWRHVRLTKTARCSTPLALGASEICVPEALLTLPADELRGALAHELAHLARRDPWWQVATGIVEALFFFQPLNRLARRRLRDAAEHLSDDWAVRQTGSAVSLARCLAAVASWVSPTAPLPHATIAMAEGGSPLLRRVERLLDGRTAAGQPRSWLGVATGAGVVGVVLAAAPSISSDRSLQRAVQQPGVEIIELPNELGPLTRRFKMAIERAQRRGLRDYWIAYAFEGTVAPPFRTDSDPDVADRRDTVTLGDVMYQGKWNERRTRGDIVPLFRMRADGRGKAEIVRIAGRSYEQPAMADVLPVYCLDDVTEEESLSLLDSLVLGRDLGPMRDVLLAMIATHGSRRREHSYADSSGDVIDSEDNPSAERIPLSSRAYETAHLHGQRYDMGRDSLAVRRFERQLDKEPLHEADLVRDRATWALALMADDQLINPLIAQLSARDWRARAYAAWGLGIAGDTRATLPIRNALRDPVWRVRVHAAYAAGALRDAGAAPALIKLLKESRWQVRAAAAENLGLLGARAAIGALKDAATRDRHPAVQDAAETALRQLRD